MTVKSQDKSRLSNTKTGTLAQPLTTISVNEGNLKCTLTANNIVIILTKLEAIEGFTGASWRTVTAVYVPWRPGRRGIINLKPVAAANTEVVRKRKAIKALSAL